MNENLKTAIISVNGNVLRNTRHGNLLCNHYDNTIGASIEYYGEWAFNELSFLKKFISDGDWVCDVGANIGTHTLYFSTECTPNGHVISFEPQPAIFNILSANIALNGLLNARAINCLVGESSGYYETSKVNYRENNNFGAVKFEPSQKRDFDYSVIQCLSLDQLNLARCNFIKADIEGMELNMLRGATELIASQRPVLYLEAESAQHRSDLSSYLAKIEYNVYTHQVRAFNPDNFYGESKNIFGPASEINLVCLPAESPKNVLATHLPLN